MSTTANMSLLIPEVNDSTYPTSISTSLTLTDAHDHTSGKGVQVPTGGIADLAVTTGKIAANAVTGAKLAAAIVDNSTIEISGSALRVKDAGVTRAKLVAVGQQSATKASFSTSSATYVDVTDITVSITVTGRPVVISLFTTDSSSAAGYVWLRNVATNGLFKILRDAVKVFEGAYPEFDTFEPVGGSNGVVSWMAIDVPAAGTYTYKLQTHAGNASNTVTLNNLKMVVYEL